MNNNQRSKMLGLAVRIVFMICMIATCYMTIPESEALVRWGAIIVLAVSTIVMIIKRPSENMDEREIQISNEAGEFTRLAVMIAAAGFIIYDSKTRGIFNPRFFYLIAISGIAKSLYLILHGMNREI